MRTLHIILLFLVTAITYGQDKTVKTKPEAVTVYLQSAKVEESGAVSLVKGKNTITIENLSNYIDTNTYQIGLSSGATLLSVTPGNNYLQVDTFSESEQALIDERDALALTIKYKEAEKSALAGEIKLIEENRKIGNTNEGWSTTQLAELATFYAKRIPEITKKQIKLDVELKELRDAITKVNKQLTETNTERNENRQLVTLEIEASRSMTTTVSLAYVVNNAGWQPLYDIRATSLEAPLSLVTKGKIYQNTGKDWDNVQLKVSTYLPKVNQNRPILNPFYIREQPTYAYAREDDLEEVVVMAPEMVNSVQMRTKNKKALGDVAVTEVVEQQFNAVYVLNSEQSIASTGKGQTIILDTKEVNAEYVHHTIPKLTEETFLIAKIKNWRSLNLLLTEANLYFEGNFIGKTTINPNYTKDEYPLSLGVDERVVVKYRLLDNLSTKRTLSSKKVEAFGYEIAVRNNGPKAINIEIFDQLPISQNNKIEIEALDLAGGDYDKGTGSILWEKSLDAGAGTTINFNYEVKYPKDMVLQYY